MFAFCQSVAAGGYGLAALTTAAAAAGGASTAAILATTLFMNKPPKRDAPALEAARARARKRSRGKFGPDDAWSPTSQEIGAALHRIQYDKSLIHFAVCGASRCGKSSFINAVRGLQAGDEHSAPIATESSTHTHKPRRYQDHSTDPARRRFVWYEFWNTDESSPASKASFKIMGLCAFDAVVVLFDKRLTSRDLDLLESAQKFGVPALLVCSKSDRDLWPQLGKDAAKRQYQGSLMNINIRTQLEERALPAQDIFFVSKTGMLDAISQNPTEKVTLDEVPLWDALVGTLVPRFSDKTC